jgi:FAD dependent oxidoreductase TIGR03364
MVRIVIVGGGVVGTAVALAAVDRGHSVVQIEREQEPRGASVRNFGLIWICGRDGGRELELALAGRSRWEALGARNPAIGFRPLGCLLAARNEAELRLIAAACDRDDARARDFRLLAPDEVRCIDARLAGLAGALHSPLDAVVEPAAALAALRQLAAASDRYGFLAGRTVVSVDGAAVDHLGDRHEGDLIVICPGDAVELIPADALERAGLRRRNLQMLETDPPNAPLQIALADGDALRYYPAFDLPERAQLPAPEPIIEQFGVQLLVAPRIDGKLTIGDTHVEDRPGAFGSDEEADSHLLASASRLLGQPSLRVRRRWTGSYLRRSDGRDCVLIEEIPAGALLVAAAGGMGMTAAPAIAAEALEVAGL